MQTLGWNNFINTYYLKSKTNQLIGKSSPQYMMYDYSLKKIKKMFPDIKLIVILRDPIERLLSHYDMIKDLEKKREI